jgi:structural maintenance of chromosome 4
LNAFYFAVKDTLVAEDIKIGTNIAFNQGRNYRVVTLNGEMVEITGVMSGGGRPKKGLMSNKIIEEFTDEQIKEVENKIQKAEQKLSQFREDHNKYE